jgi:segregation and condensation protein A
MPAAALAAGLAGAATAPSTPPLHPATLVRALDALVQVLPDPEPPPEVVPRSITLAQRAAIIRLALQGASTVVLQDLLRGVRDQVVVAVTFLAMLELMKRREVVVEQSEPFGPITARRTTAAERAAAGVAADVEDAPIDESLESFA